MSGAARYWWERFRPGRPRPHDETRLGPDVRKEIAAEFSTEELMEFLEGDLYPTHANPEFKERLRGDLWKLVQRRYGMPRTDDDDSV